MWVIQIITALYLFFFLYSHVYRSLFSDYMFLNILFVLSLIFHSFYGLWEIISELKGTRGWRIIEKTVSVFLDIRYNLHIGYFTFILHRLTALLLFLYFTLHISANSLISTYFSLDNNYIAEMLRDGLITYLTIIILGFHSINGIRLIFIEITGLTRFQGLLAYLSIMVSGIFAIVARRFF